MAKIEHETDDATERDKWRLVDDASALVWTMRIAGVIFIAITIAAFIAQVGGMK